MRLFPLLALLALAPLAGCQSDADVLASQFDQSCTVATDCVGVEELSVRGSMCTYRCPRSAINVNAKAAFDAAKQKAGAHCTSVAMPDCMSPGPIACSNGRCGYPAFDEDAFSSDVSSD